MLLSSFACRVRIFLKPFITRVGFAPAIETIRVIFCLWRGLHLEELVRFVYFIDYSANLLSLALVRVN